VPVSPGVPPRGDEGYESVTWSSDSRYIWVVDPMSGQIGRQDTFNGRYESLPFNGFSPSPVVGNAKVVLLRTVPRLKVEDGDATATDPTEVTQIDHQNYNGTVQVLVPADKITWTQAAMAPDGQQLALVSEPAQEEQPAVYLKTVTKQPKPLAIPGRIFGPLSWMPNSQALIYARREGSGDDEVNLYVWDLKAQRESQLTWGGRFSSPSVTTAGDIFFLSDNAQDNGSSKVLYRVRWDELKKEDALESKGMLPAADALVALLIQVAEVIPAEASQDGSRLTPELAAKAAASFKDQYRAKFKNDPPETAAGLDRQRRQSQQAAVADEDKAKLSLMLGIIEGEYFRLKHAASWHLSGGPLLEDNRTSAERPQQSLFAYIVNPFRDLKDRRSLPDMLRQAEGRTLILTNDPSKSQAIIEKQVDPELAKGVDLLKQGKGYDADQVFLGVAQRHKTNVPLALHLAHLMMENQRKGALRQLMQTQCGQQPLDRRKFNYLGLAFLRPGPNDPIDTGADPQQAIDAFKKAIRCDLQFGPAYLNLADAYKQADNLPAAVQCLDRYLELMPNGPYARDVKLRLRAWEAEAEKR
jgi:tetratricopeptide (TPR) repeat protein